jgi:hypothetical protein
MLMVGLFHIHLQRLFEFNTSESSVRFLHSVEVGGHGDEKAPITW